MRQQSIYIIVLIFIFITPKSFSQSKTAKYYYAYNEKIYLNESDNKFVVRYKQNNKFINSRKAQSQESLDKQLVWKDDSTCIIHSDSLDITQLKFHLSKHADIMTINPLYSINSGLEMGITDEILVKFNNIVPKDAIEKLHKKYGVVTKKTTNLYQILTVPDGQDALVIANLYQETGLVRFSTPNFLCDIELHYIPNDPYFVNQFSLHNTGQTFNDGHSGTVGADINAPEAWDITKGNNSIIIAVLDQGLTPNHPDLPNSRQIRMNGSNFADGDINNPSPTANNNHGNACAGIIAATQDNNEGITGIAPNCTIMPIRIFNTDGTGITPQRTADAIEFARQNGAHVISNSWGYNSDNPNLFPVIRDAIINATTLGRNGLGSIVLFSAGNNNVSNGFVHFPSNVNVSGVLTVGASDRFNQKSFYSPIGNPTSPNNQFVDIVAPSHRAYSCQISDETFEAWSIDIPGDAGYNSWHENAECMNPPAVGERLPGAGVNFDSYTGRFGGTSYSCPQVAAVAALILSINPTLTQQQVFDMITSTADKVGGYVYTGGRSNELGFGKLNAHSAVKSALPSISGSIELCTQGTYSISLPPGYTASWSVSPENIVSIQPNENSVTLTKLTGGRITLTALFNQNITITKEIVVGPPLQLCINSISNLTLEDWDTGYLKMLPQSGAYPYGGSLSLIDWYYFASSYQWSLAVSPPVGKTVFWSSNGGTVNVSTKSASTGITLTCTASNSCGSISKNFRFHTDNFVPFLLSLSPNPVSSQVEVALVSDVSETILLESSTSESLTATSYSVSVVDSYGSTVYSGTKKEKKFTIPTLTFRNGIYAVIVSDGKRVYQNKLVVKH